jgi:hypothetical protein
MVTTVSDYGMPMDHTHAGLISTPATSWDQHPRPHMPVQKLSHLTIQDPLVARTFLIPGLECSSDQSVGENLEHGSFVVWIGSVAIEHYTYAHRHGRWRGRWWGGGGSG